PRHNRPSHTLFTASSSTDISALSLHDALPILAVQLLSELFAWPNRRLDERDLSAMGRGAWHHDRDPGELVSCADGVEGDDGSSGLRRWRQSRSILDPRQRA